MKKTFYALALVLLVAGLTPGVFAVDSASPSASPSGSPRPVKEIRKDVKAVKQEIKTEIKEKKIEFKSDLKTIRDEGKRKLISKTVVGLIALNTRALDQFSKSLDKLDKTLVSISTKIDKKAGKGFNVEKARAAYEEAKTAIATARAAIEAQKGKVYKIEPASDLDAKDALKRARKALEADLKVVQDAVKKAREAVHRVATTLARVRKEGRVSPSPVPSASSSPSATPNSN
ncbi:MAG: hypothetical protein Q7S32_01775 [bacterium]|nr:hypothetical protein [bacterium]